MGFQWKKEEDGFTLYYEKNKEEESIGRLYYKENNSYFQSEFLNTKFPIFWDKEQVTETKISVLEFLIIKWREYIRTLHIWEMNIDTMRKAAGRTEENKVQLPLQIKYIKNEKTREDKKKESIAEKEEWEKELDMLLAPSIVPPKKFIPEEYHLKEDLSWEKCEFLEEQRGLVAAKLVWNKNKEYWKMTSGIFSVCMPIYKKENEILEAEKQAILTLAEEGEKIIKEYQKFTKIDVEELKQYLIEFIEKLPEPKCHCADEYKDL